MELFQWGTDPWGQEVLIRVSWDLLYLFFWFGVGFIVFHALYAAVWVPKLARAGAGASEAAGGATGAVAVPPTIKRHTLAARLFHWIMAAAMLVLLVTGFFPIIGVQFAWVTIHWIAGVVLTISILYHVIHATFFLDFWSIWLLPADMQEAVARVKRQLGQETGPVPKHGKYPLDHKLYHTAVMLAGFAVIGTGLVMMFRIENLLVARNAYLFEEATWGLMYALHGLGSVLFVMLTLTHIYFAVRPDKFWLTKAMIFGSVDREHYLAHHDPKRWVVSPDSTKD
jgi:cytochrome b subunit of formate dehydrogenase